MQPRRDTFNSSRKDVVLFVQNTLWDQTVISNIFSKEVEEFYQTAQNKFDDWVGA